MLVIKNTVSEVCIMGLFRFGKEKEGSQKDEMAMCACGSMCSVSDIEASRAAKERPAQNGCCGGDFNEETMETAKAAMTSGASVKVLGPGCAKCHALEAATKVALIKLGMDIAIDHVTDFSQIAAYGVMTTPALVVDGKVVSYGKVLKPDEVVKILKDVRKC